MSKTNAPLGVGVVGIGFGQQAHVPAFRQSPDYYRVNAIAASDQERARIVAERLSVPRAYGDWRELVSDPGVDVVSIATPPALQPEIALFALAQGKPVLCEKPLALTVHHAAVMLAAARRAGVPHMVDFGFTAIAEWIQAKAILERGELGDIRRVAVAWHTETYAVRHGVRNWKTGPAETGGGVLGSFVSMVLHYVEWLVGKICRLTARLSASVSGSINPETEAVLCLELESGCLVSVSVSNDARFGSGHRIEIYGDEGTIVLDNPPTSGLATFGLWRSEAAALRRLGNTGDSMRDGRVGALAILARRFAAAVRKGEPTTPSFDDGYRVQCLLEAARQSHDLGQWVDARATSFQFGEVATDS